MKRGWLLALFACANACGGAESPLFDAPATTATTTTSAEASTPTVLPTSPEEEDASADVAAPPTCTGFAEPDTSASCHACTGGDCQANGCFGGWYCKLDTLKCAAKPDGC